MDKKEKIVEYLDKAKDMAKDAKEQTAAYSLGAKEKVQGILQDAKAGKEIEKAIDELDALKEFDGSIIYKMDIETMINSLNSLLLVVRDNRIDDASVIEEIKEVMEKVAPAPTEEMTEEQAMTEKAKAITYSACSKVLAIVESTGA